MKKPEIIKTVKILNFLDVLDYLEKTRPGLRERLWKIYGEYINNDSYLFLATEEWFYERWKNKDEIKKDLELLLKEYPEIEEGKILFSVSW